MAPVAVAAESKTVSKGDPIRIEENKITNAERITNVFKNASFGALAAGYAIVFVAIGGIEDTVLKAAAYVAGALITGGVGLATVGQAFAKTRKSLPNMLPTAIGALALFGAAFTLDASSAIESGINTINSLTL